MFILKRKILEFIKHKKAIFTPIKTIRRKDMLNNSRQ